METDVDVVVSTKSEIKTKVIGGIILGLGASLVFSYLASGFAMMKTTQSPTSQTVGGSALRGVTHIKYLTNNSAQQTYPEISGSKVIWADYTHRGANGYDLFFQDLNGGGARTILQSSTVAQNGTPIDISGNIIVWADMRRGVSKSDIYMYNLATGEEQLVAQSDGTMGAGSPKTDGQKIVWDDSRDGGWHTWIYDITSQQSQRLTTSQNNEYNPDISGDIVTFIERQGQEYAVGIVNLKTNTTSYVPNDQTFVDAEGAKTDGNYIIFSAVPFHQATEQVYVYPLSSGKLLQVTSATVGDRYNADVQGDRIVWQDSRSGNFDVYLYYLGARSDEQPIIADQYLNGDPEIFGDYVAFQQLHDGNSDIGVYSFNGFPDDPGGSPSIMKVTTQPVTIEGGSGQ